MQLYLQPGHKIGKPSPLFTKIEQARLDELKKRYGGSQATTKTAPAADAPPKSIAEAEKAVAAQADKVRALKAAKAEKPVVQEQVNILLQLKGQLATLQASAQSNAASANSLEAASAKAIEAAENAIKGQGDKVRALKASKAEKAVVQAEVAILLGLKKKLDDLQAGGQNGLSKA